MPKAYFTVRTDLATATAVETYVAANPTQFILGTHIVAADGSVTKVIDSSGSCEVVSSAKPSAESAEHGAGAIGTYAAPATFRHTREDGVIVTTIKVDLTGLASVATANDVIGLAAGGAAYIGRYVAATYGIVYRITAICLEAPVGGDNDVNIVANSSGTLEYDGAGGTTYGVNVGDGTLGKAVVLEDQSNLTANDYLYLTAGTGDTAAPYTAGQYLFIIEGHPAL